MSRRRRIDGPSTAERSVPSHLLEEYGFAAVAPGEADRDLGIPAIEAADILTPRQEEVLWTVRRHGSDQAAEKALGISYKTPQSHLDTARRQLGVPSRRQAACWACRCGCC